MPDHDNRYVSSSNFRQFADHVDQRFIGVVESIKDVGADMRDLSHQLKEQSQPQWSSWFGGISIMIVMAGMAATLVNSSITAATNLAAERDLAQQRQLALILDSQVRSADTRDTMFDKILTRMEGYEDRAASNHLGQAVQLAKLEVQTAMNKESLAERQAWMRGTSELGYRNDERLNMTEEVQRARSDTIQNMRTGQGGEGDRAR